MREQNIKFGVIFITLSALCSALMGACVVEIGRAAPLSLALLFRFGFSFVLLLPWIIADKKFSLKITRPWLLLLRCVAGILALSLLFYVIHFIPLVDALLLNKTSPLFVPMIWLLAVQMKTPLKVWLGVILGFVGVALVLHPGRELIQPMALIGLLSGIFAAIAIVSLRRLGETTRTKPLLFYYFLVGTVVSAVFAAFQWQPVSVTTLFWLCALGLFGTGYQVFMTLAYMRAPSRIISPVSFSTVVFGGVVAWAWWGQLPDMMGIIGAGLIIIGCLVVVYFGRRTIKVK